MSGPVTLVRGAACVIAWDAAAQGHTYLHDADVAFQDGVLRFVGRSYDGAADVTIDGRGLMVMPGLVNIHSHPVHRANEQGADRRTRQSAPV